MSVLLSIIFLQTVTVPCVLVDIQLMQINYKMVTLIIFNIRVDKLVNLFILLTKRYKLYTDKLFH